MSTFGVNVQAPADSDDSVPPPPDRAFKIAEAFGLAIGSQLLVCVDGMRVSAVGRYLSALVNKGITGSVVVFDLKPVANVDAQTVLAEEGVRELRIKSTMMAATAESELPDGSSNWYRTMISDLKALFIRDVEDPARRDQLAERWAELNVETVVKVRGGARGDEIALDAIEAVGRDMLDDSDSGFAVELTTGRGNKVSAGQFVLSKFVDVDRRDRRNDLDIGAMWTALERYESELRANRRWQS